jgi:hypothetical protein
VRYRIEIGIEIAIGIDNGRKRWREDDSHLVFD